MRTLVGHKTFDTNSINRLINQYGGILGLLLFQAMLWFMAFYK